MHSIGNGNGRARARAGASGRGRAGEKANVKDWTPVPVKLTREAVEACMARRAVGGSAVEDTIGTRGDGG